MVRAHLTVLALAVGACSTSEPEGTTTDEAVDLAGRVWVDTREPADFAEGHVAGAINLQLGWSQLEHRSRAYLPDPETPIALRTGGSSAAKALGILESLGYRDVEVARPAEENERLSTMTSEELAARLGSADPPVVIDVRSESEWNGGIIDGALLFEQDAAPSRVGELDPEQEYAVICAGGYRSSQLASLMCANGFERVHNVIGGMWAWQRGGYPTVDRD